MQRWIPLDDDSLVEPIYQHINWHSVWLGEFENAFTSQVLLSKKNGLSSL